MISDTIFDHLNDIVKSSKYRFIALPKEYIIPGTLIKVSQSNKDINIAESEVDINNGIFIIKIDMDFMGDSSFDYWLWTITHELCHLAFLRYDSCFKPNLNLDSVISSELFIKIETQVVNFQYLIYKKYNWDVSIFEKNPFAFMAPNETIINPSEMISQNIYKEDQLSELFIKMEKRLNLITDRCNKYQKMINNQEKELFKGYIC